MSKEAIIWKISIRRNTQAVSYTHLLNIIKNGPSERRRFIDMELCQLNKLYVHSLVQYNKVLLQRNKLLKELFFKPEYEETPVSYTHLDVYKRQQPNSVNGPLKKPRIASAANNIHTTYSLVGMIPPITSLKNGEAYVAHVLNMGSVSRKPIKGAVSTTPS